MNNLYNQIKIIFEEIQSEWGKVQFDEDKFIDICDQALANPTNYNFQEILEFTNLEKMPTQSFPNDEFGEVPFTVFRHEKFFIDIYMWNIHNTSIHDHNFIGVFKLLNGRSMKVNYEFKINEQIAKDFHKGELQQLSMLGLKVGDREKILPFDQYIHKITHFTNPTVTLLIRTNGYAQNLNIYNKNFVFKFYRSHSFQHKFNCIKMIYSFKMEQSREKLKFFINKLDSEELFLLLSSYININPAQMSADNVKSLYEDLNGLVEEGYLPKWFTEFLKIEIEGRQKEMRFQKMKVIGIF